MCGSCCPPAYPPRRMDESGANLDYRAIDSFYDHPRVQGLAEMMNSLRRHPRRSGTWWRRSWPAQAHHKKIDGHAPGLVGQAT